MLADEVASLPGWPGKLPSRMFSGYVDVSEAMGNAMKVHYLYIMAEDEASADPTILWTNGGPGASSMFGVLVELGACERHPPRHLPATRLTPHLRHLAAGPLLVNEGSLSTTAYNKSGVPTLFRNPYAWTKLGSLLMFDWPPPVGFSYCHGDPTGNGTSCGEWDDARMADAMHAALSGWYRLFPERRGLPLYLTGESYAGEPERRQDHQPAADAARLRCWPREQPG